ncbi:MAG TPA: N-acetyl-alpha-D-glucosaminyl L-malate synthase BshA [Candidatus Xenobia bacterium]
MNVGITCYPTIGGSGILATSLGEELANRGHQVHIISYERPVRLRPDLHFHPVAISGYELFKYPDYTLPLSVKMAEVSEAEHLDVLHVHYAVPHATAAILARSMLPPALQPRIITTLHGTDTTLLGQDAGYGPAIRHAIECSDAVTAVSHFLRRETQRLLAPAHPIEVIYNFYVPRPPLRSRDAVRRELGVHHEALLLHASNLRPLKRIDVLLETVARVRPPCKLLVLAGEGFEPYQAAVHRLGLDSRVLVRHGIHAVEEYLNAADLLLMTSDSESFCLSILEAMWFACPAVSTSVGGVPEVVEHGVSGLLAPAGDVVALSRAVESLLEDPPRRQALGEAARERARQFFSADAIVSQYEALYRRLVTEGRPDGRISVHQTP